MNFPDTVPGDRIQPGSAARYNAVNALLRAIPPGNHTATAAACRTALTVDVCNTSPEVIAPFTAVAFADTVIPQNSDSPHLPCFGVTAAVDDTMPWGIAAGEIAPGAWGTAVVSGTTPAHFARTGTGEYLPLAAGDKVIPAPEGLLPHCDHGATVLCPAWQCGTTQLPGVILLERTAAGYHDDFTVSWKSFGERTLAVSAGETEFPGLGNIAGAELPAGEIAVNDGIYLVITYTHDDTGKAVYSAEFQLSATDPQLDLDDCFAFQLALYRGNAHISQRWTGGKITMPGWLL